ncbi:MAG TPA: Rieske 2Fe-2S domain-containing protein [Thermoplasmata archaeon]|nr:Rieske 2Fe-2S domain-containing protein [Thermoplasmata archaeon]
MSVDCPPSCPFIAAYLLEGAPLGQLERLDFAGRGDSAEVDETKRNVLKLLAVAGIVGAAGGGLVGGTLQFAQPPPIGLSSFPRVQLLDLDGSPLKMARVMQEYNLGSNDIITFNYPLRDEPNFLLNLAPGAGQSGGPSAVVGGIGPSKSVVAFSAICQHLGCQAPNLAYYPPGTCSATFSGKNYYLHCACHGSTYDPANGAANLTGPAVLPLPQVTLEWQSSDDTIWANGMTGPTVNGKLNTLQGDYPVGSQSQLVKQPARITLCPIV